MGLRYRVLRPEDVFAVPGLGDSLSDITGVLSFIRFFANGGLAFVPDRSRMQASYAERLEEALNCMAVEGWELVSSDDIPGRHGRELLIFRRDEGIDGVEAQPARSTASSLGSEVQ